MWVCTEWLGSGLQIRAMQVRPLSPTPILFPDGVMVTQLTLTQSLQVRVLFGVPIYITFV